MDAVKYYEKTADRRVTFEYILLKGINDSLENARQLKELIKDKKLDFSRLVGSGGMPSSHSALMTAMTASVGKTMGLDSVAFAIAAVTSLVVMYDAANVRREAGKHAAAV